MLLFFERYMWWVTLLCGGILVALSIVGIVLLERRAALIEAQNDLMRGERAGALYMDRDGNMVSLASFSGKPLLVSSWASWSPQCMEVLPILSRIANDYSGKGLAVVAINRKEEKETALSFLSYINEPQGVTYLFDPKDLFYSTSEGYGMPRLLLYDGSGRMLAEWQSAPSEAEVRKKLDEYLP